MTKSKPKKSNWWNDLKDFAGGKKMIEFDFKKFMTNYSITVEDLAGQIKYSTQGVITMLERGTVKMSILEALKPHYNRLPEYVKDPKIRRKLLE